MVFVWQRVLQDTSSEVRGSTAVGARLTHLRALNVGEGATPVQIVLRASYVGISGTFTVPCAWGSALRGLSESAPAILTEDALWIPAMHVSIAQITVTSATIQRHVASVVMPITFLKVHVSSRVQVSSHHRVWATTGESACPELLGVHLGRMDATYA